MTEYWDKFYKDFNVDAPSNFASSICLPITGRLLELGCGNGRDTMYFASQRPCLNITALDTSVSALKQVQDKIGERRQIQAYEADATKRHIYNNCDVVYHRFFLHAVPPESQVKIIKNSVEALRFGGLMCFECRSDKNHGMHHTYGGHDRWLVNKDEVEQQLASLRMIGCCQEIDGVARYQNENPIVIRYIGTKI